MLLSIIIPVFNIESYLTQCVNSLLCEHDDYEIILVDDGSTDGSQKMCDEYANRYCNISVYHKKNGGVSSARNYGLAKAKGKYIYFVDGDDWVENVYELLSVLGSMDEDVFCTNYKIYDKDNIIVRDYKYAHDIIPIANLKDVKPLHFHTLWGYVFKKKLIADQKLKFCEDLKYAEDWVFVNQYLANVSKIYSIKRFCYNYRLLRSGSAMSQKLTERQVLLHFQAYDMINQICPCKAAKTFIESEKRECFSYVLNVCRDNTSLFDDNVLQQMIRQRVTLSMLACTNIKFIVKVSVAYFDIYILKKIKNLI